MGILMLWMLIFTCEVIVTGGSSLGATTSSNVTNVLTSNTSTFLEPTFQESTNLFTAAWAVVVGVAPFLTLLAQALVLWSPTVFSDPNMLWIWWCICLPVDVGMAASLIFIVRGVHSA